LSLDVIAFRSCPRKLWWPDPGNRRSQLLMDTIVKPSGSQNGALTFIGPANHGHSPGLFGNIEGGSNFDFGAVSFGMKGGC
jgi:hypothetical protein